MPTILARVAALGFLVMTGLHTYAFAQIMMVARAGPNGLSDIVSVLWLAFSLALVVLGAIVWLKAPVEAPQRRATLLVASAFPLGAALLQIVFMGFVAPEAILGGIGLLTLAAAIVPARPAA